MESFNLFSLNSGFVRPFSFVIFNLEDFMVNLNQKGTGFMT